MGKLKSKLPDWADPLLQGLSYWIGYKKQLYRHYPLSEGAIVGEAVALIYANLDKEEELHCELMYKRLSNKINDIGNARADIVIKENDLTKAIIEVKRIQAPSNIINDDFKKLRKAKEKLPNASCFLLLVSQNRRPTRYVTDDGIAERTPIRENGYKLSVRRVCKASDTFKKIDNANYACLIEVELNEE